MTMPNAMKLRIANDLGLTQANEPTTIPAPVSRRTLRAVETKQRSTRPWAIGLGIAAAVLLVLTAVLRWGMPIGNDQPDNHVLLATPAVPTVAVSPDATPSVAEFDWTADVSAEECPVDELMNRGAWSDLLSEKAAGFDTSNVRQDAPYVRAETGDAEVVILRQRQAMACLNSQEMDALPIESSRRAWEFLVDAETNDALHADRVARSQEFSQWVETQFGLTPADLAHQVDDVPGPIWLSENAVEMADGRIALIPSWRTTADDITQRFGFYVPVWENVDGDWLLDEELFFCIGECDEYWGQIESAISNATPIASKETSLDWLVPISTEECILEDSGQQNEPTVADYDAIMSREYTVVGPADPADANVAVEAARIAMSCDFSPGTTSMRITPFELYPLESFTPALPIVLEKQMQDGILISSALEDQGWEPGDLLINAGDNPAFADVEDQFVLLPQPDHVIALEDGRLVIPMTAVNVNPAANTGPRAEPGVITIGLAMSWEDGTWKVDDQIPLCIGVCTGIFSQFEEFAHDGAWLRPITAEECEGNQLLPNQMTDQQAAATKSRQYRACDLDGDASALQGPSFQVTEGPIAQALSEEIGDAYANNGERPASLQRVADPNLVGIELPDEMYQVFVPASAVELPDGRIAVLETTALSSESDNRVSIRTAPVVTQALVWIVEGDTWLLDEEVTVCLGNCDSFWSADEDADATPEALILAATCDPDGNFAADFTSHPVMPVGLRPGPGNGSGLSVATIPSKTPLQYLCENAESTDLKIDPMEEGQLWLKVRTEDGTEGWIREIDVQPLD